MRKRQDDKTIMLGNADTWPTVLYKLNNMYVASYTHQQRNQVLHPMQLPGLFWWDKATQSNYALINYYRSLISLVAIVTDYVLNLR